jgi:hypothetical protein
MAYNRAMKTPKPMTKHAQFLQHCSLYEENGTFQDLAEMMGGLERVFCAYLSNEIDEKLKDFVLTWAPLPLCAFLLGRIGECMYNILREFPHEKSRKPSKRRKTTK